MRALLTEALSLSFSFSGWFPWSAGALCIQFPAWASKTHSRRCLRWGTFRDSRGRLRPTWTEQVPCWGFIGFLHKPRNISLFSLLYFLNCKIISLSLYLFFCQRRLPEGIPGSNWGWSPVNIDILGISKLQWTGMGDFNSDDHYIYYYGQESLRRNGVAIKVNKRIWNTVLGCNLKNDRMISVHFQGKPFKGKIYPFKCRVPNNSKER